MEFCDKENFVLGNPKFPHNRKIAKYGFSSTLRSPVEGYYRSWNLKYSDLIEKLRENPIFCDSLLEARHSVCHSLLSDFQLANMFLIIKEYMPRLRSENIIEFGSYRAGTAIFMALVLRECQPKAKVYALDSFQGIPSVNKDIDLHEANDFNDIDRKTVDNRIKELGLDNIVIISGEFKKSFPFKGGGMEFGLAHVDCDVYESVNYVAKKIWRHLVRGAYVIFDDVAEASCLGATQAVEEMIIRKKIHSEQAWPHFVYRK